MRTIAEFIETIEQDKAWRKKEIIGLQFNAKNGLKGISRSTLIRSGVPLVYAHWEGYVKHCTKSYLCHLSVQSLSSEQLTHATLAIAFKSKIRAAAEERSTATLAKVLEEISAPQKVSDFVIHSSLMTESNLKWDVFVKIVESLGIDPNKYSHNSTFITDVLLKNRNIIAHGSHLLVGDEQFQEICKKTNSLIDDVYADFSFLVTQKMHLRSRR